MNHHYVPQFLLAKWAARSPDQKVEVFRLDLPHLPSSRRSPRGTGYEPNLYALDRPNIAGMSQHAVETLLLKDIDNFAAVVMRKLEQHDSCHLTDDDRCNWVNFLMSLKVRTPENVKNLKFIATNRLKKSLATTPEIYKILQSSSNFTSFEQWVEAKYPGLIENLGLSLFRDILLNEIVGEKIVKMTWIIWDFSKVRYKLILADRPCIFSQGIDDSRLIIALPISPRKLFMAVGSESVAATIKKQQPAEIVSKVNEYSLLQAKYRVYSEDTLPRRFIVNRLQRLKGRSVKS